MCEEALKRVCEKEPPLERPRNGVSANTHHPMGTYFITLSYQEYTIKAGKKVSNDITPLCS